MSIVIDQLSGRVEVDGTTVGKIHHPREYEGKRVARKSWMLVIRGTKVGDFRTFVEARRAAIDTVES